MRVMPHDADHHTLPRYMYLHNGHLPVGRATENRGHRRVARAKAPPIARVRAGLRLTRIQKRKGLWGAVLMIASWPEPCRVKGFEKILETRSSL
ncbi:hypothetical protein EV126DRAFT_420525, partial [Verticillium dahliae]